MFQELVFGFFGFTIFSVFRKNQKFLVSTWSRYGEDLQVASLGAVPKDLGWEEVRVVHDGTHGIQVNTEIKQPNRMTFPQFDDLEAAAGALERRCQREDVVCL